MGLRTAKHDWGQRIRGNPHRLPSGIVKAVCIFLFFGIVSVGGAGNAQSRGVAGGTLQVRAVVQSSIQLAARIGNGDVSIAGGNREATVLIQIDLQKLPSTGRNGEKDLRLTTIVRAAALPNSSGYWLEAAQANCRGYTMKIDGVRILPGSKTDITTDQASGDPYGTEIEHRVALYRAVNSPSRCTATLVLTARPKR